MPTIIIAAFKGPGPHGPSSIVRYNPALDQVFLQNLAATCGLRDQQELQDILFSSAGEVHSHAAMPAELKHLSNDLTQGPQLGLEVVEGELRIPW